MRVPFQCRAMVRAGPVIVRVRRAIISEPFIQTRGFDFSSMAAPRRPDLVSFAPWRASKQRRGWQSASGVVKVTVGEAVLNIAEGDRVELFGRLVALRPPQIRGPVDWRAYYRMQGVGARLYCDQRENVVLMSREGRGFAS